MLFIYYELRDIQARLKYMKEDNFGRVPSGQLADTLIDRRDQLEQLLKEHSEEEYSQYVQEYYG